MKLRRRIFAALIGATAALTFGAVAPALGATAHATHPAVRTQVVCPGNNSANNIGNSNGNWTVPSSGDVQNLPSSGTADQEWCLVEIGTTQHYTLEDAENQSNCAYYDSATGGVGINPCNPGSKFQQWFVGRGGTAGDPSNCDTAWCGIWNVRVNTDNGNTNYDVRGNASAALFFGTGSSTNGQWLIQPRF